MPHARRVGGGGEDAAIDYLLSQGFTLLKRNFRCSRGEIDVVCLDGEELVFVEVKLREGGFSLELAVDEAKQDRLRLAAEHFLLKFGEGHRSARFDVIGVRGGSIRHIRGAF